MDVGQRVSVGRGVADGQRVAVPGGSGVELAVGVSVEPGGGGGLSDVVGVKLP